MIDLLIENYQFLTDDSRKLAVFAIFAIYIVEAVLAFSLISFKYSKKKTAIIIASSVCGLLIVNVAIMLLMAKNLYLYAMLVVFFVDFPLFIIGIIISKQNFIKSAFAVAVAISFSAITIEIGYFASHFTQSISMTLGITLVVDAIVTVGFLIYIKRDFREKFISAVNAFPSNWKYVIAIPMGHWFVHNLYMNGDRTLMHFIIMSFVNITTFTAYRFMFIELVSIKNKAQQESKLLVYEHQVNSLVNQINTLYESEKAISILRHDVKHFAGVMREMVASGEIENAKEYSNFIDNILEESSPVKYCDNAVLNACITCYANIATSYEIQTTCNLQVPSDIQIPIMEFSTVLANAMENAINATIKIADVSNRKMQVSIKVKNQMILTEIINTYQSDVIFDENGLPVRKNGVGVGISSIQSFATKHNASLQFETEGEMFIFKMILPISQ